MAVYRKKCKSELGVSKWHKFQLENAFRIHVEAGLVLVIANHVFDMKLREAGL